MTGGGDDGAIVSFLVQKVADGEALGGRVTTVEDFRTDEEYADDADFLN